MHLWRPRRQQIDGQELTREGSGFAGQELRRAHDLARHGAGCDLHVFNREQRLATGTIEHEEVSLFSRLRNALNRATVSPHRHQTGRGRKITIPDVMTNELKVPKLL